MEWFRKDKQHVSPWIQKLTPSMLNNPDSSSKMHQSSLKIAAIYFIWSTHAYICPAKSLLLNSINRRITLIAMFNRAKLKLLIYSPLFSIGFGLVGGHFL